MGDSKAFDNSAVIGTFIPLEQAGGCKPASVPSGYQWLEGTGR